MDKDLRFPDCTSTIVNKKLLRMNCLILAATNEKIDDVLVLAEGYYAWVMERSVEAMKRLIYLEEKHNKDEKDQ